MHFDATNFTVFTKDSTEAIYKRELLLRIIGSSIVIFLGVAGVQGNIAVILTSFWNEVIRSQASNMLLVKLALTDVLTGLFVTIPAGVSVAMDYWAFGVLFCRVQGAVVLMGTCSSVLNIAFITVDRGIAVMKPFLYQNIITAKVIAFECAFILAYDGAVLISYAFLVNEWVHYDYSEGKCATEPDSPGVRLVSMIAPGTLYGPALLTTVCNVVIIFTAIKSNKKKVFIRRNDKKSNDSVDNRAVASMTVVVVFFFLGYLPYVTSKISRIYFGRKPPEYFNFIANIFLYMSSSVNPFIYGILRKDYRNAYKKLPKTLYQKIFVLN